MTSLWNSTARCVLIQNVTSAYLINVFADSCGKASVFRFFPQEIPNVSPNRGRFSKSFQPHLLLSHIKSLSDHVASMG